MPIRKSLCTKKCCTQAPCSTTMKIAWAGFLIHIHSLLPYKARTEEPFWLGRQRPDVKQNVRLAAAGALMYCLEMMQRCLAPEKQALKSLHSS